MSVTTNWHHSPLCFCVDSPRNACISSRLRIYISVKYWGEEGSAPPWRILGGLQPPQPPFLCLCTIIVMYKIIWWLYRSHCPGGVSSGLDSGRDYRVQKEKLINALLANGAIPYAWYELGLIKLSVSHLKFTSPINVGQISDLNIPNVLPRE